jgi:hypothetical protein
LRTRIAATESVFKSPGVLMRFDHVARFIVNANHSIIALAIEPAED